jgi:uncharacterized membrane protein YqaE (UPF0057 family)
MRKLVIASLATIVVLSSCTIEKRLYTGGYHVQSKFKSNSVNEITEKQTSNPKQQVPSGIETSFYVAHESSVSTNEFEINENHLQVEGNFQTQFSTVDIEKVDIEERRISQEDESLFSYEMLENGNSHLTKEVKRNSFATPKILLYILALLIPWLAVGLATDWEGKKIGICLLLTLLFLLPGIIYAFIVVGQSSGGGGGSYY